VDSSPKKVFINCWTIFLLESQVGNGVKKEQTSAENQLLKNNRQKNNSTDMLLLLLRELIFVRQIGLKI
jgi:hypothetical protein